MQLFCRGLISTDGRIQHGPETTTEWGFHKGSAAPESSHELLAWRDGENILFLSQLHFEHKPNPMQIWTQSFGEANSPNLTRQMDHHRGDRIQLRFYIVLPRKRCRLFTPAHTSTSIHPKCPSLNTVRNVFLASWFSSHQTIRLFMTEKAQLPK